MLELKTHWMLLYFLTFLLLLVLFFRRAVSTSDQSLPKYDTQVRIQTIYLLLSMLFLVTTAGALRLTLFTVKTKEFMLLPLGLILGLPLPLALFSYLFLVKTIARAYRAENSSSYPEFAGLSEELNAECRRNGIVEPKILVSKVPFLSPQVFGTVGGAYLLLPQNYPVIMRSLKHKLSQEVSDALEKFAMSHELAHLQYKDYVLFSWLCSYLRWLIWLWFPLCAVVIAILLWLRGQGFPASRVFATMFVSLSVLVQLGLLYMLTLTVMRDREILADYHAMGSLPVELRSAILQRTVPMGKKQLSPFELMLGLFPVGHRAILGSALGSLPERSQGRLNTWTQQAKAIVQRLVFAHPTAELRLHSLTSETDYLLIKQGDRENGIFLGAAIGLLFVFWGFGMVALGVRPPSAYTGYFFFSVGIVAMMMLALTIVLPLKCARARTVNLWDYDRRTIERLSLAALSAGLVIAFCVLPVVSVSGFILFVKTAVMVSASAYVLAMLGLMLLIGLRRTAIPERVLWRLSLRVFGALLFMALIG